MATQPDENRPTIVLVHGASAETDPQVFNLRLGGVRQRARLAPKAQVWCGSALPWSMDLRAVKQSM